MKKMFITVYYNHVLCMHHRLRGSGSTVVTINEDQLSQ